MRQTERMTDHELCFALTVHKSQGSEFDRVILILPEKVSPVLTAELIYTAVTRTRKEFEIFASEDVFLEAASRRIRRPSGIVDAFSNSCPLPVGSQNVSVVPTPGQDMYLTKERTTKMFLLIHSSGVAYNLRMLH